MPNRSSATLHGKVFADRRHHECPPFSQTAGRMGKRRRTLLVASKHIDQARLSSPRMVADLWRSSGRE